MKNLLVIVASVASLLWGTWYIVLPTALIEGVIEDSLGTGEMKVDVVGLRKGLFMSLRADAIDFTNSGRRIATIAEPRVRLDPSGAAHLKAAADFEGLLGNGKIDGSAALDRGGYEAEFMVDRVRVEDLRFLEPLGIKGSCRLTAQIRSEGGTAELKFTMADLQLDSIPLFGETARMFDRARGIVNFRGGMVDIKSIGIEGEGAYIRARGVIQNGDVDMTIEFMPDEDGAIDPALALVIEQYRVSPGYYVIPVRTRIRTALDPDNYRHMEGTG